MGRFGEPSRKKKSFLSFPFHYFSKEPFMHTTSFQFAGTRFCRTLSYSTSAGCTSLGSGGSGLPDKVYVVCSPKHCPQRKSSSKILLHFRVLVKASPLLQSYAAIRGCSQYKCWRKVTRLGLPHTLIMSIMFWFDFHALCGRTSQNTWNSGLTLLSNVIGSSPWFDFCNLPFKLRQNFSFT